MSDLRTTFRTCAANISRTLFNDATEWTLLQIATAPMVVIEMTEFDVADRVVSGIGDVSVRGIDADLLSAATAVNLTLPVRVTCENAPAAIRMVFIDGLFDSVEIVDHDGSSVAVQNFA